MNDTKIMTTVADQRERVLKAVYGELQLLDNETLDDWAREILGLPDRPDGAFPFVGWLTEEPPPSKQGMEISQTGIDLIKRWEGFRSKAYLCPAGVWTIGYGHTSTARRGQEISKEQGEQLLDRDLVVFEKAVNYQVKVALTQGQFDALVSFAFNCGTGALQQSTLLRKLNQGNYYGAATQFGRWVHAGRKVLPGLVSRREEEKQLFLSTK